MTKLAYESGGFAVAARKAIVAGDVFTFEVRGAAFAKLRPNVVNDEVPGWASLAAIPELRAFVAVMALSAVSDRRVTVHSFEDYALVQVGSMH